ncbi:hypothetical protein [Leucobacter chinensis]|uniref:hypothetical protein n=1 Tax=Leucobacter chinensis TaxID=2851010 RepID=UPI001C249893|nr:hypothetical protein [Leucobacter chinensis]
MPVAVRRHFATLKTCALYIAAGLMTGLVITGIVWITEPSGFIVWVAFMLSGIGALSLGLGWICGSVMSWVSTKLASSLQMVLVALTSVAVAAGTAFALLSGIPSSHTVSLVAAYGVIAMALTVLVIAQSRRAE